MTRLHPAAPCGHEVGGPECKYGRICSVLARLYSSAKSLPQDQRVLYRAVRVLVQPGHLPCPPGVLFWCEGVPANQRAIPLLPAVSLVRIQRIRLRVLTTGDADTNCEASGTLCSTVRRIIRSSTPSSFRILSSTTAWTGRMLHVGCFIRSMTG